MPRNVARISRDTIPLTDLIGSWERSLKAANKSPYTVRSYTDSARALARFYGGGAHSGMTTDQIRGFLAAELGRISPASVAVHYRNLRVFWAWLATEEPSLVPVSPMTGITAPKAPRARKPPFSHDELAALLATCSGPKRDGFEDRRDHAILRVFIDTGVRISGMAGLRYPRDVDLNQRVLTVTLKGGATEALPVGRKAVSAIDRYLRARVRHPRADEPWLWLSRVGTFGVEGIRQMLARRAAQAGVEGMHPHRFRRTFAHDWLEGGGTESDLMKITGWKTRAMIEVYAGELAAERARQAHARLSPGDRI